MSSSLINDAILTYLRQTAQHTAHDALSLCFAEGGAPEAAESNRSGATSESLVGNGAPVDGIGDIVLWGIGKSGLEDALSNFWVRCVVIFGVISTVIRIPHFTSTNLTLLTLPLAKSSPENRTK